MIGRLRSHLRRDTVRVAGISAAIVAIVYLVIAVTVTMIVQRNLTSEIDRRLSGALTRFAAVPLREPVAGFREGGSEPRFGPPLLIWAVDPSGSVVSNDTNAPLPPGQTQVGAPVTASVGGTDVRLAGADVNGRHVVVGQTMDSVYQARSTLILAETIVGPLLVAAVFFGALAIGRRVAAPLEMARQRQLEFTADASHELRTPLSVIEAQTRLALTRERDAPWLRSAFERIDVENRRMRRLVDDMLWLARFDATTRPLAEHVDVAVMAAQAIDRFSAVAEERRLSLRARVSGDSHVISAPPEWVDRLLGVLIDNACKYAPEGGSVEVDVSAEGHRVRLAVEDSGPGIDPAERGRIFDRFHRATDQPGGTGLGLAIGDAVVRATGGRWEIGASPAGGASMAVVWPRTLAVVSLPGQPQPAS